MAERPSNLNRSKIMNIGPEEIQRLIGMRFGTPCIKCKMVKLEDRLILSSSFNILHFTILKPEMLKEGGDPFIEKLADSFNRCMLQGEIPEKLGKYDDNSAVQERV